MFRRVSLKPAEPVKARKGGDGTPAPPFDLAPGERRPKEPEMLLEKPAPVLQESCRVVLETERLVLRRPTLADVKAIARLANDRRVAQNTVAPAASLYGERRGDVRSIRRAATARHQFRDHARRRPAGRHRHRPRQARRCRRSATGSACPTGARAMRPKPRAPSSTMRSRNSAALSCAPAPAWSIRPRAACWRSAASSGPACELLRVLSLGCSVPVDRFRLDRGVWTSLKSWRDAVRRRVAGTTPAAASPPARHARVFARA